MATTKAKSAKGTKLQIGDGAGTEVFTDIGDVVSFAFSGESVEVIDATSFDDSEKEYISSGIVEGGEVSFEINYSGVDTQHIALRTDMRAGTQRNFKVKLNDQIATAPTTIAFSGFITKLDGPSAAVGEAYKGSITIKLTGKATHTAAT